jgi:membrane protein DedA with SNARE-associated domain
MRKSRHRASAMRLQHFIFSTVLGVASEVPLLPGPSLYLGKHISYVHQTVTASG